eukprot:TRINITY_DN12240_c2_g3_i4.p1 TRINITY_DN12240_c2_g3~~TRINITY_DN12240_c2_g3_i4.p1  ORF type:complete len:131 (-),score=3.50 TRINITY_DN12240_c2_g3_i4:83-475(-)
MGWDHPHRNNLLKRVCYRVAFVNRLTHRGNYWAAFLSNLATSIERWESRPRALAVASTESNAVIVMNDSTPDEPYLRARIATKGPCKTAPKIPIPPMTPATDETQSKRMHMRAASLVVRAVRYLLCDQCR